MYKYTSLGLLIKSELEMPYLPKADFRCPDVTIKVVLVEEDSNHLSCNVTNYTLTKYIIFGKNVVIWEDEHQLFLLVPGLILFVLKRNSELYCYVKSGFNIKLIEEIFVDEILPIIAIGEKTIVLHSGCVMLSNKKAIFLLGKSGSGKSSITNALTELGAVYLAEDMVAVSIESHTQVILNSVSPYIRLWSSMDGGTCVPGKPGKYYYLAKNPIQSTVIDINSLSFIILMQEGEEDPCFLKLNKRDSFIYLLRSTMGAHFLTKEQWGLIQKNYSLLTLFSSFYVFSYKKNDSLIQKNARSILSYFD